MLNYFKKCISIVNYFYDEVSSLLDYLPKNGLLIFDEMGRIQEAAEQLDKEEAEFYTTLLEQQQVISGMKFSFDWTTIKENLTSNIFICPYFYDIFPNTQPENIVNMSSRAMQEFHGQMPVI